MSSYQLLVCEDLMSRERFHASPVFYHSVIHIVKILYDFMLSITIALREVNVGVLAFLGAELVHIKLIGSSFDLAQYLNSRDHLFYFRVRSSENHLRLIHITH